MKITRIIAALKEKAAPAGLFIEPQFVPDCTIVQHDSAPITLCGALKQTGWTLTPKEITRYEASEEANLVTVKTANGESTVLENAKETVVGSAYAGTVTFSISADEMILGLGQHEDGIANYRGVTQYLYQNNMHIPMPVFVSTAGYAVLFDAACLMVYHEKDNQITVELDAVEQIAYYVIQAEKPEDLIKGIRRITGKAEMLPAWSYGYVQSKEHYDNQWELVDVAKEFKKRGIPVSCIVQDWLSWENGKWGNKHLDKTRYPNLKESVDALHEMEAAFMISVWPDINPNGEDNAQLKAAGKLLANHSTYDAFDPIARDIYWQQCEYDHVKAGTDAWWCDSTEPFTPDWRIVEKLPEDVRYDITKDKQTHYMDARVASTYALHHAIGIYEHQRKAIPQKRVVNLTRSGSPSIQKYGTIIWSGDIAATWDTLRRQIIEGLQMSVSGIPYWTQDAGAFFVRKAAPWYQCGDYDKGCEDLGYRELYTRWIQYCTFLPIMRSHGMDTPREPWNYGDVGSIHYDTIVKYIKLRYRLMPYFYSMAWDVYRNDGMFMRPAVFADKQMANVTDEYLFGSFLVCPVTFPMEYTAESTPINVPQTRDVILPSGSIWYDYETKDAFEGGKTITASAPVNKMPLYVKSGSIIPTSDNTALYSTYSPKTIGLEVYSGENGSFTCYFDKGNGYEYLDGENCTIKMDWDEDAQTLTIGKACGNYPYPQQFDILLTKPQENIRKTVTYHGEETIIRF